MKRIFCTAAASLSLACGVLAQDNIAPLMRQLPQRTDYNPAFVVDSRAYFSFIGLGGANISVENTGFCFDDIFMRDKRDSLHIDLGKLASNMRAFNLSSGRLDIPFFTWGKRIGDDNFISIGLYNKTRVDAFFDRSLTNVRLGNWDYDNSKPIDHDISDVYIRALNYFELSAGFNRTIFDGKLTFGAKARFLAGLFAAQSDDLRLKFQTERMEDRYRVNIASSGSLKTSLPLELSFDEEGYVDNVEISDAPDGFNPIKNKGAAFDIGMTLKPMEGLRVGLSVVDLGFIKWNDECNEFSMNNDVTFIGVDISNDFKDEATEDESSKELDSYWDELTDSLLKFTDVSHVNGSFVTPLSSRVIASAEYDTPLEWLSLGATMTTKFFNKRAYASGSLSAHLRAGKWLSFALSGALSRGGRPTWGSGVVLRGGPVQFFFIADRIPLRISQTNGFSASVGFNFLL